MRKTPLFMLLAVVIFSACNDQSFKKGKDGIEYKIIGNGSGPKIQYGDFMQLNFATYYNTGTKDSMMNDSRKEGMAIVEKFDSVSTPPAYFQILRQVRKGDSVVVRILTDSFYKKAMNQMPPFFKKGHYIVTTLKIENIFKTKEEAETARTKAIAEIQKRDSIEGIAQKEKDIKQLQDYFAKNKITVTKAPLGTYVEMIQPGTGKNVDTSSIAQVFYAGRTLDGKEFDSNNDPSKGPLHPLMVNFTNDADPMLGLNVIPGWKDGMSLLNKGAKARLYIPSGLGYGTHGMGNDIAPNAILVFDVEINDILDKTQAKAFSTADRKKMEDQENAMRQHYMDSISKTQPKTVSPQK